LSDFLDTPLPPPLPAAPAAPDWQPLPLRSAWLAAVSGASSGALLFGIVPGALWVLFELPARWWSVAALVVVGTLAGAMIGFRRQRRTRWRLDAHGLGLRRDLLWQHETRVPLSRVQHLDLRRGPIERNARLSTLVVHTAGSRFSAVTIGGLDSDDAERLRDTLAYQLDQDDDAL